MQVQSQVSVYSGGGEAVQQSIDIHMEGTSQA